MSRVYHLSTSGLVHIIEKCRSNEAFRNIGISRRLPPHNGSTDQDVCWTALRLHTANSYEPFNSQEIHSAED